MTDIKSLDTMMKMHIKECDDRDKRNTEAIGEIKEMFRGIWDAQDDVRKIVTSLQIKAGLALGGLIVIGKVLDYVMAVIK